MFSPTALVNLPTKKLSFTCSDLFPDLKLAAEPIAAPQEEPIQVMKCDGSMSLVGAVSEQRLFFSTVLQQQQLLLSLV